MTRNPTTAHLSLIKELQTLLNKGSEMNGYPGGVMLSYSGTLSEKTSNSLIALTENAVCQCGVLRAELLRTKSVVTDCLKSFSRYGWIDEKGEIEIYLILDCAENGIHVKCGGFFKNDTSIELAEKIDSINEMSINLIEVISIGLFIYFTYSYFKAIFIFFV